MSIKPIKASNEIALIANITNGNFEDFQENLRMYAASNSHNFGDLNALAKNHLSSSELDVFHRQVFLTLVNAVAEKKLNLEVGGCYLTKEDDQTSVVYRITRINNGVVTGLIRRAQTGDDGIIHENFVTYHVTELNRHNTTQL